MSEHTTWFAEPDLTLPPDFQHYHRTDYSTGTVLPAEGPDDSETFLFDARCPLCRKERE